MEDGTKNDLLITTVFILAVAFFAVFLAFLDARSDYLTERRLHETTVQTHIRAQK